MMSVESIRERINYLLNGLFDKTWSGQVDKHLKKQVWVLYLNL